ncbi:MAG: 4-(cytidine 5'-diphospho)-2-C-methyl-D-erythritol kinase [Eubacteriales bacterium]
MHGIILKAYAKINLCLNIEGKRKDGYHDIDTVMLPISLYDTLRIFKDKVLTVNTDSEHIPNGKHNIAYKAASIFLKAANISSGAHITINKRIPSGAGLGGGSSNAAAVILALNKLYETKFSIDELVNIAKRIGADVPFFLYYGCKRAQGIGEVLNVAEYNIPAYFVIVNYKLSVSTAKAYSVCLNFNSKKADMPAVLRALKEGDLPSFIKNSANMLEAAAKSIEPKIKNAFPLLKKAGSLSSMITGSGSAVFGVFDDIKKAILAKTSLEGLKAFDFVFLTQGTDKTFEEILTIY